ncbi:hypothetical protein NDU88_004635 [Pleurodeles waltl]|uniref:Uncharacterized protein n=1 Tax=Pleurodeles waltl TaxID=8319 RepID=A0AAV7TA70_PLEWA|nr:hypothetical protein NDU88_004635 [Pleurodeles waltl]
MQTSRVLLPSMLKMAMYYYTVVMKSSSERRKWRENRFQTDLEFHIKAPAAARCLCGHSWPCGMDQEAEEERPLCEQAEALTESHARPPRRQKGSLTARPVYEAEGLSERHRLAHPQRKRGSV